MTFAVYVQPLMETPCFRGAFLRGNWRRGAARSLEMTFDPGSLRDLIMRSSSTMMPSALSVIGNYNTASTLETLHWQGMELHGSYEYAHEDENDKM